MQNTFITKRQSKVQLLPLCKVLITKVNAKNTCKLLCNTNNKKDLPKGELVNFWKLLITKAIAKTVYKTWSFAPQKQFDSNTRTAGPFKGFHNHKSRESHLKWTI